MLNTSRLLARDCRPPIPIFTVSASVKRRSSSKWACRPPGKRKHTCQEGLCHRDTQGAAWAAPAGRRGITDAIQFACDYGNAFLAGLLATAFILSSSTAVGAVTTSQDKNDSLTIKFKASKDPAIREAQEALVQTWGYASTQFLDPNFNGVNWPQQLQVDFKLCSGKKAMLLRTIQRPQRCFWGYVNTRKPTNCVFLQHNYLWNTLLRELT